LKKSNKRNIDLPKGCKDLHDVLVREKRARLREVELRHGSIPPISRQVQLPAAVTVRELATIAQREPTLVIADLLGFGTMALGLDRQVGFERAAMVLLTYGIEAERRS